MLNSTRTTSQTMVLSRMFADLSRSFKASLDELSGTPLNLHTDIGDQLKEVFKGMPTQRDSEKILDAIKSIRPAMLNVNNRSDKLEVDGMYGEEVIDGLVNITENVKKVPQAIDSSTSQLMKALANIKLEIPDIQEITGKVEITNKPEVSIPQLTQVVAHLASIKGEIQAIKIPDIKIPNSFKIDNIGDIKEFVAEANKELLNKVAEAVDKVSQAVSSLPRVEFPDSISIDNFPPQKIPQPVTHMSINSLNGYVKTTAVTVSTTLGTLPSYGVLSGRRSLQIYNNSSDTTIYIGGSDVTATNGLPVPPLSYSPALDAGIKLIIYGVTSSGSANARVVEISDEESGR